MAWKLDERRCVSCGACVGVCPYSALELKSHGPVNDKKACILCGICEKACPVKAIKVTK